LFTSMDGGSDSSGQETSVFQDSLLILPINLLTFFKPALWRVLGFFTYKSKEWETRFVGASGNAIR